MKFVNFLKSVAQEMKLVTWPNAQETKRDTSTVVGTSILMAIFLGLIDWAFQWGLKLLA
ncbi:preprotein translocase subunit SecE [Lentilactobacillus laojiaonis]|nr:preprotein translocase subunit SecE [Lentilactobacillus laojiaonis]UDM31868.1 preprotein translocase subunit SecE [Lentilactobacillus laojiaonis]